jgi:hypothetical protein
LACRGRRAFEGTVQGRGLYSFRSSRNLTEPLHEATEIMSRRSGSGPAILAQARSLCGSSARARGNGARPGRRSCASVGSRACLARNPPHGGAYGCARYWLIIAGAALLYAAAERARGSYASVATLSAKAFEASERTRRGLSHGSNAPRQNRRKQTPLAPRPRPLALVRASLMQRRV